MESSTSSSTKPNPTFQLQSQDEHKIVPSSRHSRRLSIERPHNGKPISKIICSPRMKYAGTWSNDDKSAILWSIITGQHHLKYENEISRTSITLPKTLSAVSDNMHIVIKTNSYHLNFEMFEMMNKQKPSLRFPNSRNVIDRSEFTRNGDFVAVSSFPSYRAFIFTPTTPSDSNSEIEWILTSMLELSYFSDSFITIYGNLILFNDKTFQLTNWNIETLKLQTNCPIDWSYVPDLVEVTEDEELLGICAKNYTEEDDDPGTSRIYIYSTMNGMNLATYDYDSSISIDKIYFIAYEIGERLLVISHNTENNIKKDLFDPYTLENPVNAENLFENGVTIQNPYIIKFSQIIGLIDGSISIYREFIRNNWVNYLRDQLNDYNNLFTLNDRKAMHEMIKKAMNIENYGSRYDIDHIEQEETYPGRLLKWELDCQFLKSFILKAFYFNHEGNEWLPVQGKSQRNIFPNFHSEIQDRPQYIIQCRILDNDDLFMITTFGVLIWTIIPDKGIRLLHYWGNEDLYYQELTYTKLSYSDTFTKRILPPPEFDIIIKFKELSFGPEGSKDVSYFFKELIEDYITNKFSIIFYGSIIMNSFVKMNADLMIEKLCESCFEFNFKPNSDSNNISTSNIQLLSIIIQIFPELLQKDPNYLEGFLSRTAFVIPFIDQSPLRVREKPSIFHSSHLYQHGTYNYLSKTSIINIFISRIYERWKHFQYDQYKHRFDNNNKNFSIYSYIETFITIPFQNWYDYYNFDNNITIKLLLPLPKFISYPESYNTWSELWNPLPSNFIKSIDGELYKYWNCEALLNFKWNTYGRKYYLTIWLFYIILLGCFTMAATKSNEISLNSLTSLLQATFIFGIWHLMIEFRKFTYSPLNYIMDFWNLYDFCVVLFPVITSILWLQNGSVSTWLLATSSLLLELKFILFFRIIEPIGIYIALIISVAKRILVFLIIMGFIILAFAHSFHLLLRPTSDISSDGPSYNATGMNGVEENDQSVNADNNNNIFSTFGDAILATYLMLIGDSTSISPSALQYNTFLTFLVVAFSFFTILYLLNLFIGILSKMINETNYEESFLIHKAKVLAEIELFYMLPHQRRKRNWFPEIIFYTVHVNKLRNLVRIIQNDKWNGFEKPYLSPAILKVIKVEYDNFSKNKQVEIEIGEIKELIMNLRDNIVEIDE
ncbi:hypothetical protein C2G38_1101001 [Gigaspora rosea]|uniref:Ion transport domain-containing protein n=1 Tax=Gigaspora rosea TaxID=44941 RepID=A0A397WC27_9GLOM|nr:hypothetical protein C2G38_1101001 [Gigaspora rosea]